MSTWIYRLALALGALALAGCEGGLPGGSVGRKAPERIQLADGTVVAGTRGWCIDPATSRAGDEAAVIVLGSCAAIARNARAPKPEVPGVMTVSLEQDAGAVPGARELEKYLATDAGRAALALDGRAESVTILETVVDGERLYLRVRDESLAPGTSAETWRALFDLGGRFASVSLFARADEPFGRDEGLHTLAAQVSKLAASNRAG